MKISPSTSLNNILPILSTHSSCVSYTILVGSGSFTFSDIATDKSKAIGLEKETVFLSGNGPLVQVLSEALARDKIKNQEQGKKQNKKDALREVKKFIQNIHHFRDMYIHNNDVPFEKVVVFDESQRAWDQQRLQTKMKEKGHVVEMSEPDLLISVLDRHQDWCVIVCLVGGGQEINLGEAGISTWIESIDTKYPGWKVYLSDEIKNKEYSWGYSFDKVLNSQRSTIDPDLHLSVSLRSFRSENLSNYINAVIDGNKDLALKLKETLEKYPLKVTRDINAAKNWLRSSARGTERFGMVAESNAIRLKAEGIFVKYEIDPPHWFLDGPEDIRSSYFLEDVASEYAVQGLELDWVCMCWDSTMRKTEDGWDLFKFSGSSYKRRQQEHHQKYLLNAHRVLLTRARQGLVIFIPKGDKNDPTRKPEFYDCTYNYLIKCGFELI